MACVAGKLPIQTSPWDTDACVPPNFSLKSPSWCSQSHPKIAAHPSSARCTKLLCGAGSAPSTGRHLHGGDDEQTKSSTVLIKKKRFLPSGSSNPFQQLGGIIYLSEEHQGTDLSPFPGPCTAQKWWSAVPRVMLQARLSCSDSLLLQKEVICYHCSWHQIPHLPGALEPSLSGGERIWFTKPGKMYS